MGQFDLDRHVDSGSYPVELQPGSGAEAYFRWMLHSFEDPIDKEGRRGVPVFVETLRSQSREAEAHDWELGFHYFQEPEPRLDLIALYAIIQYAPRNNLPVLSTTLAQYYQAGFTYRPPNLRVETSAQRFERITRDAALLPLQIALEQQQKVLALQTEALQGMTRLWTATAFASAAFPPVWLPPRRGVSPRPR